MEERDELFVPKISLKVLNEYCEEEAGEKWCAVVKEQSFLEES